MLPSNFEYPTYEECGPTQVTGMTGQSAVTSLECDTLSHSMQNGGPTQVTVNTGKSAPISLKCDTLLYVPLPFWAAFAA